MAVVLCGTAALGAVGAVGAARVTADFDYQWFLVDGWYRDNVRYEERHFRGGGGDDGGGGARFPVGLYTPRVDYFAEGDQVRRLLADFRAAPYVVDSSLDGN